MKSQLPHVPRCHFCWSSLPFALQSYFSLAARSLFVRSCFEPQVEEETRATLARKKSSAALGESHAEEQLVPLGLVQLTIKAIDSALQEIERHVGEVEDGRRARARPKPKNLRQPR